MRPTYEVDEKEFDADGYKIDGYKGIAWNVLGWETTEDSDTEWTGMLVRTGNVVACMIGDDRYFVFDRNEVNSIEREEFCGECGQIGCQHDGIERVK